MRRRDYTPLGKPQNRSKSRRRVVRFLLLLVPSIFLLHTFGIQSYQVGSESMMPTLQVGDRLLTLPLAYGAEIPLVGGRSPGFVRPSRGDVVLVRPPYGRRPSLPLRIIRPVVEFLTGRSLLLEEADAPEWDGELIVKRIVAIPGDTVRMSGSRALVQIGSEGPFLDELAAAGRQWELEEPELPAAWSPQLPFGVEEGPYALGDDEYFVLGDSRGVSVDSRSFGPVHRDAILQRVALRYFPFGRIQAP